MATDQKPAENGPWFGGAVDEDLPPPAPTLLTEQPARRNVGAWFAIALGVLIIGFLAESVFLFRSNAPEHERSDVLALSRRFVVAFTTYDASTLPSMRATVLGMTTNGQFRSDFDRLTNNPSFATALTTAQATSSGKVVNLAVSSVSGDGATVLGVVDVTVTNKDLKVPRIDRQVIQMTLVHTSSGWKVDSVTVLGKLS